MDSDYDDISDEEMEEINSALKNGDPSSTTEKINEYLNEIENAPLNIAITGDCGTGKSTFVNAILGIEDGEVGSAPTGVVETTMKPTPYTHPQYPNVTVWDLPGIGTPNFVADNYLEAVEFNRYDFFIIISSERFKENDIVLAKEIQAMDKKFYFVRSKVDSDLSAFQKLKRKTYNEKNILKQIKNNCITNLIDGGITEPKVFLLSCLDLDKYDFNAMQETLEKDLPEHKRLAFVLSLPNISLPVLKKKRKALRKKIWMWAFLACAAAAVPIPSLSVACDIAILIKAMTGYRNAFGLDEESLNKLATKANKDVSELKSVLKSPLALQEISIDLVIKLLRNRVVGAFKLAKYILSHLPGVGNFAAGGMSFGTIYWILSISLKEIAEDANRVREKAVASPVENGSP